MSGKVPKTPTTTRKKGSGGRIPGEKVPASPALIAKNRVRAWKHGKYAKTATLLEKRVVDMEERAPGFVEVLDGYLDAVNGNGLEAVESLAAVSMTEQEFQRREVSDKIMKHGVLIEEALFDKDGVMIATRFKANPLLEVHRGLAQNLGHTAADMQLTRKSRGEGAKDDAIAASLRRDAELRGMPKETMALPPGDETPEAA